MFVAMVYVGSEDNAGYRRSGQYVKENDVLRIFKAANVVEIDQPNQLQ